MRRGELLQQSSSYEQGGDSRLAGTWLEKHDPKGVAWRKRYFVVDEARAALLYFTDERGKGFKGAVPLELILGVTADPKEEGGLSVEIAQRSFKLRVPKDGGGGGAAQQEQRAAFIELLQSPPDEPLATWLERRRAEHRRLRQSLSELASSVCIPAAVHLGIFCVEVQTLKRRLEQLPSPRALSPEIAWRLPLA